MVASTSLTGWRRCCIRASTCRRSPPGRRSIEGAATSTTIFVGETERGPLGPVRITSRADYERIFGGYFRVRDADSPPADPDPGAYGVRDRRLLPERRIRGLRAARDGRPEAGAATAARGPVEASSPGLWGNSVVHRVPRGQRGTGADRFRIAVVYESPATGERELVEVWDRLCIDRADENFAGDVLQRSQLHPLAGRRAADGPRARHPGLPAQRRPRSQTRSSTVPWR